MAYDNPEGGAGLFLVLLSAFIVSGAVAATGYFMGISGIMWLGVVGLAATAIVAALTY